MLGIATHNDSGKEFALHSCTHVRQKAGIEPLSNFLSSVHVFIFLFLVQSHVTCSVTAGSSSVQAQVFLLIYYLCDNNPSVLEWRGGKLNKCMP